MSRIARTEVGLALAAGGLAVIASLYFIIALIGQREVCYGVRASKLRCETITLMTPARMALVMTTVLAFYAGGIAGAWLHQRAKEPGARAAALGLLCTCAVFVLSMTVPLIQGAGFFLLPSMLLLVAAAVVGLYPATRETWRELTSANGAAGNRRP
ncbi:MAG: hypothetical protein IVW57_07445 [Ktedonobacterales bacterium]|nr:hypothetical protein [Ktedonobacterales bacterium]